MSQNLSSVAVVIGALRVQHTPAMLLLLIWWERSGSVVECLTGDQRAAGSGLTGVTALWSLSKTHFS